MTPRRTYLPSINGHACYKAVRNQGNLTSSCRPNLGGIKEN